jgi:transcriptional regulator with XRE-family HTH domain
MAQVDEAEAAGGAEERQEQELCAWDVVWSQRDLASRLRALRRCSGVSRGRIARMTGISTILLSRYETGKELPTPDHLVSLSEVLNASVVFLVRGENRPSAVDLASLRLAWTRMAITPKQRQAVLRLIEGILSQLPSREDVVN